MCRPVIFAIAAVCCSGIVSPSIAATVNFTGLVVNTCVINISTPGLLALATSGTTLSSEETLGANAILAVIATGSAPEILFAAPQLTGASNSGAVTSISYASPGGAAQAYTSASSAYTMNRLLDTVTVKARATNANGFASGTYAIASTVTCQQ